MWLLSTTNRQNNEEATFKTPGLLSASPSYFSSSSVCFPAEHHSRKYLGFIMAWQIPVLKMY